MKVEIKCDPDIRETKVVIYTKKVDEEILSLQERIVNANPSILTGFHEEKVEIIELENIIRIYAYDGKVYVVTGDKEFIVRLTLYEIEERLSKDQFVRVSRSDIVNLKKVKQLDLSFSGTISIEMKNGDVIYVSRRKLKEVKSVLGI